MLRRRGFLRVSASAFGGVLVFNLQRQPNLLHAQSPESEHILNIPLYFFKSQQAGDIAAATECILPADEHGPGARAAGVTIYIDRQLAGPYGQDKFRYRDRPFRSGVPEQGYQDSPSPQEIYREGLKWISGIQRLESREQDRLLAGIERTRFFQLLRAHTIEGMFSDPVHGGNRDMVGWKLVGFPGVRYDFREMLAHPGEAYTEPPVSLLGRAQVRP